MPRGPVGKLGPVPAIRGIGLWAPRKLGLDQPDLNKQLLPFDWGVPYGPPPLLQTWISPPSLPLLTTVPVDTIHVPRPFDYGVPFGSQPLLQSWTFSSRALIAAIQAPFNQDDWPLATPPYRLQQSWTWAYNLNLIGKDQLPVGETVFELVPRAYSEPATRTWTYAYNLNLIGQDRFPSGEDVYDLTPRPYAPIQQSWALNLLLTTLLPLPYGKQFFDLSPIAPQQILPRSWTWNYNLNLIAQDALVTGKQVYDLAPIGPTYPISLRTWASYVLPLFAPVSVPFSQDDWPLPGRYTPIPQSWAWAYNLNLVGKDVLIVGEQVSDLVPRPYPEPATRTWAWWYNLNLIGKDRLLVGKQSYDLTPIAPLQILPRSWTASYNLNLIGQDQLPTGEQRYDLAPVGPFYATQLRTWIYFTPPTPTFAFPFNQYDWPNPKPYPEPATRTWSWAYNLNLVGQDRMTVGEQVYDLAPIAQPQILPRTWIQNLLQFTLATPIGKQWWERAPLGPIQPLREWAWRYNLNLVGQDQLPTGEQEYKLTPAGYIYPVQLRTWIDPYKLALNFVAGAIPYLERNWPNPNRGPQQPDRFYSQSYNLNLIGKDKLPTGKSAYDLAPHDDRPIQLRSFTGSYNLNLVGKDQFPTGDQVYDLSPKAPIGAIELRTWINQVNLALKFPPVTPGMPRPFDWTGDPIGPEYGANLRSWVNGLNLSLLFPATKPFAQTDWQLPDAWVGFVRYRDKSFISGCNLCIGIPITPPAPPPTPPVGPQFVHNPGNEWQIYDRIREPGPVGWR